MSVVACNVCEPLVAELRTRGFEPELLVEGLSVDVATLEDRRNTIPWDTFTVLLERTAKLLGGKEALEDLAFRHTTRSLPGFIRGLLPFMGGAKPLVLIGARWLGPWMFRATRAHCEELPDGRIREVIKILPPHRSSPEFLWANRGIMRAGPPLLGLPEAVVESEDDGRDAEYIISLPPSRRRFWPVRESKGGLPEGLAELGFQQEQLRESLRRTRFATDELAQKSRRLDTLEWMAQELNRTTDLGQLAERILQLLSPQLGLLGIRLTALHQEDELVGAAGQMQGQTLRTLPLRQGDAEIGKLELWYANAERDQEDETMVASLLPWLSIALANAHTFALLSRQTTRLQEEIAERRRTEDQLERSQHLDALGRLAGGLAHDMNNMITAVIGFTALAGDTLEQEHPARRDLEEISTSCERATALLSQVLAFARRQVLVPTVIDLREAVERLVPMLDRLIGEQIDLQIVCSKEPIPVLVDPGQLEQVVVNLVANARDAIEATGHVSLEIRQLPESPGFPYGAALLVVRDDGCGIDPNIQERIFEPFFTTKPSAEGTGIGLSSAFGTVTQSGGQIELESAPGEGTTVSVRLPRANSLPPQIAEPRPGANAPAPGGNILLVEDDEAVRRMARRILEAHGYDVVEAANGPDALAICETREQPIDLLLTDMVMPEMDGGELARRTRRLRPELRAVLTMSGYSRFGAENTSPLPADEARLRKPFTVNELLESVGWALSSTSDQKTV
ncbi:MAG: response regulator [bacterium]|nr:response regulator [bacterium]